MTSNFFQRNRIVLLGIFLTVVPVLSGCVGEVGQYYSFEPDEEYVNPGVFPGDYEPADPGTGGSVLDPGFLPFSPDAEVFYLRSEVDGEFIPVAVWRPYDGLVEGGVPIIVDAGPYFELYDEDNDGNFVYHTIDEPQQSGSFVLKNYVPHGYAYAQVAVRGMGTAGGCVQLMSNVEARDITQAINFLGDQPWSNGNAAMIGVSYDGSTPWMVAAQEDNRAVKAIVPISGLPDIYDLMFHNGSAETRGPLMHSMMVYWAYGFNHREELEGAPANGGANGDRSLNDEAKNAACAEAYKGHYAGVYSVGTGARDPTGYWGERDYRDDVLANYKGSVFLIHGLQDWNVDPHAAIPFNQQLKDAGIEVKELYGQWGHARPDSQCAKQYPDWLWTACRVDYAEVLLRYFDNTLKGNETRDFGALTQLQDNYGNWRNADSYPPKDAQWLELFPSADGTMGEAPEDNEATGVLLPPGSEGTNYLEFKSGVFDEDVRISGLPQMHVTFDAAGPAGFLGFWLWDEDMETGKVLATCEWVTPPRAQYQTFCDPAVVAHGQLDLRFYQGGEDTNPPVAGARHVALGEFEPLDIRIPAGHRITLWLFQWSYGDHNNGAAPTPVPVIMGGQTPTVLRLPTVTVDPLDEFPVPGSNKADPSMYHRYLVPKPAFSQIVEPMMFDRNMRAQCLDDLGESLADGGVDNPFGAYSLLAAMPGHGCATTFGQRSAY